MPEEFSGYVVPAAGRTIGFSKRTDAAALFRALRMLDVPYRQAEDAVAALLGVDRGELSRGLGAIESCGEEQDVIGAVFAIGKNIEAIRVRMADQHVNAEDAVAELPAKAQDWFRSQVVHFSQGT